MKPCKLFIGNKQFGEPIEIKSDTYVCYIDNHTFVFDLFGKRGKYYIFFLRNIFNEINFDRKY